jgi:hypothetical protein
MAQAHFTKMLGLPLLVAHANIDATDPFAHNMARENARLKQPYTVRYAYEWCTGTSTGTLTGSSGDLPARDTLPIDVDGPCALHYRSRKSRRGIVPATTWAMRDQSAFVSCWVCQRTDSRSRCDDTKYLPTTKRNEFP